MTLPELQALLKRVTYKPNWKIYASYELDADCRIHYDMVVPADASGAIKPNPGETITVSHSQTIHGMAQGNEDDMLKAVRCGIQYLERHEYCEWLRVDGQRVTPVHTGQTIEYKEYWPVVNVETKDFLPNSIVDR